LFWWESTSGLQAPISITSESPLVAATIRVNIIPQGPNWEAFYTSSGIPGIARPTAAQIDLAAQGAAWGDSVGVALANNLGPLNAQAINFLEDAAQGTAIYSASLSSQPNHAPFQGAATASVGGAVNDVQLTGVAAHIDHGVI
jgi:hypothetical protein